MLSFPPSLRPTLRPSTGPASRPSGSSRRPPFGLTRRGTIARHLAIGVLAGVAAASAGSILESHLHDTHDPGVSVAAETAAAPTPVVPDRAAARASRSRSTVLAKRIPTKQVTQTVEVGPSFDGQASWYGGSFQGQRTADGEHFDTDGYTAASKTLPFGTRVRVCHDGCVVVRINDRGPYVGGRVLDLTRAAANAIGFDGVAQVTATPVGDRTVTVVDRPALVHLRAYQHAFLVQRSHALARAAAAQRRQVLQLRQVAARLPVARGPVVVASRPRKDGLAAGLLVASTGGLVSMRRRRS